MTPRPPLPASGLYRAGAADRRRVLALERRARARRFAAFTLDLAGVGSKAAFLRRAAEAMAFPAYFGQNWDAFYDCVTDLGWRPAPGYLVRVVNAATLARRDAPALATALELLDAAAAFWREQEVPFLVVLEDRGLPAFGPRVRSL